MLVPVFILLRRLSHLLVRVFSFDKSILKINWFTILMVTAFEQRVYDILLSVPTGRVTTYKELGNALGKDNLDSIEIIKLGFHPSKAGNIYRAIGQALHKNPFAPRVPCHRVVCADGPLGGFAHGSAAKIELLASEGVAVANGKVIDFEEKVWRF